MDANEFCNYPHTDKFGGIDKEQAKKKEGAEAPAGGAKGIMRGRTGSEGGGRRETCSEGRRRLEDGSEGNCSTGLGAYG